MNNFWIVLFDSSGNPNRDFTTYMGHDENFDSTDGLIALGPLKAENLDSGYPNSVIAVVDGRDISMSVTDTVFAIGDIFCRVNDEEYRKLFGEEAYSQQLEHIREDDAGLARLQRRIAELPTRW